MGLEIEQDPTGFSKSFKVKYPHDETTEFLFHKLELDDSIIFNIHINGIIDTTLALPINSKNVINLESGSSNIDDPGIEPVILVGNHANLKIQIIATQLSKLFIRYSPKPVTLSLASRWFGQEIQDDDFDKIMWVSEQVNILLS